MIKPRALRLNATNQVTYEVKSRLSLSEIKSECKRLGITNSVEYKKRYKEIPGFPANLSRTYAYEWVSYKDFFDIKEFISYQTLVSLVQPLQLKNAKEFKKFISEQNDTTLPYDPQTAYQSEWDNWYKFLGKEEPYRIDYIPHKYKAWAEKIAEFMKQAKGGESKISQLCRFVRFYIQTHDKSISPEEFLTQKSFDIKPYRKYIDGLNNDNQKRKQILAINQFLDYVIDKYLTIEDEDTGEIVRVMNARNPFTLLLVDQSMTNPQRSETTKPCLPYHFVRKMQNWIIPTTAKNFKDLKHLHKFDADWVKVHKSFIDQTDPDCVYRIVDGQYHVWIPIDWIHTYTLTKVPLRGRQIAYNDSGEGDKYIADVNADGKIVWVLNNSPFAGMLKQQSFIKRMSDEGIGMFVTTNKTSNKGEGYSIPWMPEDLAYWLVKLRKWQQKYNAIKKPTSWSECTRTNFNEIQLKAKGMNCFLFRAFCENEPRHFSTALAPRLAAALYHIQPENLKLASLDGLGTVLTRYDSKYTPHSMRVSLITAYVMEMGMPIEIVMKVVGHSSVVMTIYYTKISNHEIRRKLEEGEKIALKSQAETTQKLIEQNQIEKVKNNLIASNADILRALHNDVPAGNFVFRDYGICPFAASRCDDGGEIIGSSLIRAPTPSGYLGMQNCLRCRHFVTGPAFLGGLLSIANEILLQSNLQSNICRTLQEKVSVTEDELQKLDKNEYIANLKNETFDVSARAGIEINLRNLESDYESAAKKLDMLLCDLQSSYGLIHRSQQLINKIDTAEDKEPLSLIVTSEAELQISLEEVSYFHQLQEVCENAVIYQSASANNAILPRTQILDRMALFNDITPTLFLMTEAEQLHVGNELFKLLKSRLRTWSRIDEVLNCEIKIDELLGDEQILKSELQFITKTNLHITE